MVIAYAAQGTVPSGTTANITGSTSVTPAAPTMNNGDMVLIVVSNKPDTSTPTTPTDWTLAGTVAGGSGASANNSGATRTTVFYREKTAAWSTMPAISIASGNSSIAQAFVYSKTGSSWDIHVGTGADNTNDTTFSVTTTTGVICNVADWLFVAASVGDDALAWSAQNIAVSPLTMGAVSERAEGSTTTGNDIRNCIWDCSINSGGSAVNAVTASATLSVATQSGPAVVVRLREIAAANATVNATVISGLVSIPTPTVSAGGGGGGGSVTFGSASNAAITGTTSVTVALPSGTTQNDLLLSYVLTDDVTTTVTSVPSGWVEVPNTTNPQPDGSGTDCRARLYYKFAGASEPQPTWTMSANVTGIVSIVRYVGAATTGTFSAATSAGTASSTTHATPSITPADNNTMVVSFIGTDRSAAQGGNFFTPPSGWTERVDFEGVGFEEVGVADITQSTAAAISGTWTFLSGDAATQHVVALKPGGGGGTNATVTATVISGVVSIAGHTVSAGSAATVTPAVISGVVAVAGHTVSAGSASTVTPAVISLPVAVAGPVVSAGTAPVDFVIWLALEEVF